MRRLPYCPLQIQFVALAVLACLSLASQAADGPDPLQLLSQAAQTIADAPSASVAFKVSTELVRDEMKDEGSAEFVYRTAPGGRFEFRSVDEKGKPSKSGYHVAGNGDVVLTALLSRKRHMIELDTAGITSFVRSPGATGIGSGLGGIALAFFHPTAMEDLAESVVKSELISEEEVDGVKAWRARYVVGGGIETDIWFRAEGKPLVLRVAPNVLKTPAIQQMGSRFEKFDYKLWFDYNDWNTDANLSAEDLPVVEPTNSMAMASLYRLPPPPPHKLLGEAAPEFELPTPEGEAVSLTAELKSDNKEVKQAVLVEFWATTCPACVQAMPALEKVHEQYADKGLKYVAVNVGESAEEVASFLEAKQLQARAVLDESTEVAEAYEVQGIPLILLVGPDGRVHVAEEGFMPGAAGTAKKIADAFEAITRGEDPAAAALEEARTAQERRVAELDQLRSKLDG